MRPNPTPTQPPFAVRAHHPARRMPKRSAGILLHRRRRPRGPARPSRRPVLGQARRRRVVDPQGRVRGRRGPAGRRAARVRGGARLGAPGRRRAAPSSARSGRRAASVVARWAAEGDLDATAARSNTFEMEWPPAVGPAAGVPRDRSRRVVPARPRAREARAGAGGVPGPAGSGVVEASTRPPAGCSTADDQGRDLEHGALMNLRSLARHGFGAALTVAALGLGAGSAHAAITVSTPTPVAPLSACSHGSFSQPLLAFKDTQLLHAGAGRGLRGRDELGAQPRREHRVGRCPRGRARPPERGAGHQPAVLHHLRLPEVPDVRSQRRRLRGRLLLRLVPAQRRVEQAEEHRPVPRRQERLDAVGRDEHPAQRHTRAGSRPASPSWPAARKSHFQVDDFWVDPKMRG